MKTPFGHHSKLTEQLKQDRICKAAPALLEALENVLKCGRGTSGRIILEQEDEEEIIAAIASAKGKGE